MDNTALSQLLVVAARTLRLKRDVMSKEIRRQICKRVHNKQYEEAEKEIGKVVQEQIQLQMESIIRKLPSATLHKATSKSPIDQVFDKKKWTESLVDAVLPVMAIEMSKAAVAQFVMMGVDPRIKSNGHLIEKHLPGQHDQSSHGRGGGGEEYSRDNRKIGSEAHETLGNAIANGESEYSKDQGIAYPEAAGVDVPKLRNEDEIYLVRYTTSEEHLSGEGVGFYAYGGRHIDDVVNATQAYSTSMRSGGTGTRSGYLLIGRYNMRDEGWEEDLQSESNGVEVNGVLGSEYAPVDVVIRLSDGAVSRPRVGTKSVSRKHLPGQHDQMDHGHGGGGGVGEIKARDVKATGTDAELRASADFSRYRSFEEFTSDIFDTPGGRRYPLQALNANAVLTGNPKLYGKQKPQDYELKVVKVKDVKPSQSGEDYINDSSRETARTLRGLSEKLKGDLNQDEINYALEDVRLEDMNPIAITRDGTILDGNHRHAAAVLNKEQEILALVPVGEGTGRITNLREVYGSVTGRKSFLVTEKHLPGKHDQMDHGHGGLVNTKRDADGKLLLADGSPLPDHIPKNIPPAWVGVAVAKDPKAELLVQGYDAKGRRQSVYSAEHKAKAAAVKFARVNELREKHAAVVKEIDRDMKSPDPKVREAATVLALINHTGIRPGSETDTGGDVQAYGATTLQGRHVSVRNGKVTLKFVGKKGVDLEIPVSDPQLAKELIRRKEAAGRTGKLFNTSDGELRNYTHQKDGGSFKPKDFRTARGTSEAVKVIETMVKSKTLKIPTTLKEFKKFVKEVATPVSKVLGNTPTVAAQSYIDPVVFAPYKPV